MRGSSSAAPRRPSTYDRMRGLLRDWDVLFAELGAQVAGRTTLVRSTFARTAARFAPRRHDAERELVAFRDIAKAPHPSHGFAQDALRQRVALHDPTVLEV